MPNKDIIDRITDLFGVGDLIDDLYTIAKDGYTKGLQVGKNQLAPLNVKVETSLMGKNLSPDKLKIIKDLNEKYVNSWLDRFAKTVYDTVYDGMEKGKTLKQITDDIMAVTDKDVIRAKREAADIIIAAARRGEIELYRDVGIKLFRDIAIVDNKTCGVCMGLNGRIYREDFDDDKGSVNYDTKEYLRDEIQQLKDENGYDTWTDLDPYEGQYGPQYHSLCRCHFVPVLTFDQYKGNVQTTISEV